MKTLLAMMAGVALAFVNVSDVHAQSGRRALRPGPPPGRPQIESSPNILLLVADDLGVDQLASYGLGSDLPHTPQLDSLAAAGVQFRNAWSNPTCSPTRATLQTGRSAFRTGLGTLASEDFALPLSEVTIPEMLDLDGRYSHAAIGKWHLGNTTVGDALAPNLAGYSHFAGSLRNLDDYAQWDQVVDGTTTTTTVYPATAHVDAALAWINGVSGPWFVNLSFNNPHSPWHAPPAHLHGVDLSNAGPPELDPRPYYRAMVEAMDTEIGRLLAGLGAARANTTVIFVGDNGSHAKVIVPPFNPNHGKHSLFDGGINVPLIVEGPSVSQPGTESDALVQTTDLFATIAEIAGIDLNVVLPNLEHDSVSFAPHVADSAIASTRTHLFAEKFIPNGVGMGDIPGPNLDPCNCQPDLGFGGPGTTVLSICGAPLALGNPPPYLRLSAAPPGVMATLLLSLNFNPTPMHGGMVTPIPTQATHVFVTNAQGRVTVPTQPHDSFLAGKTLYHQMLTSDPLQAQGISISNTVAAEYRAVNSKAIRNHRYKLITRPNSLTPPEMFDLFVDPFEEDNLLDRGLSPDERAEFQDLNSRIREILGTPPFPGKARGGWLTKDDCPYR